MTEKDIKSPKKGTEENKSEKVKPKLTPEQIAFNDLRDTMDLITRGIRSEESRFIHRAVRNIGRIRRALTSAVLQKGLALALNGTTLADGIVKHLDGPTDMDVDGQKPKSKEPCVEEVQMFSQILAVVYLMDNDKLNEAAEVSKQMISQVENFKLRSPQSHQITAKCYFYFALSHERIGAAASIRKHLFDALRTATLRSDETGKAVVLNLLLRNFLSFNLVDQAMRLISKTEFPIDSAPNSEAARYLYYLGRIQAIQLDYSASHKQIELAIRKASRSAIGFLQHATKLSVIVSMLLGEIPSRGVFGPMDLRKSLNPYFKLTQAVRVGDLKRFESVVQAHGDIFRKDKNYMLILRLRHNVIKTGVRMINISYSRISLEDMAKKLQLDSAEDAEYIVAKAIRDGVIDASINHEESFVQSNETRDVYSTTAPQGAFHSRIKFCMDTHEESIKGMRYPPNAYRRYLETSEETRKLEQEENEIAAEMDEMDEGW